MHGTIALRAAALAVALFACPGPSTAQSTWPTRPVRLVIPFAPAGGADVLGRMVALRLSETLGQQVVSENRTGGGGLIAAETVARAEPDGYTLIVSGVGGFIIVPAFNPTMPLDPIQDFTHIALFGGPPTVLAVNADMPARTLADFIALARENPGGISYGLPAAGSHSQLITELFQQQAGIRLTPVAYRAGSQAINDLVGGHVPAAAITLTSAAPQMKVGKVRALAVSSDKRIPEFPDVPTYAEQGFPDLVATTWFALSGPANMPPDIVKRLNAEVVKILQEPDMNARLESEAIDPPPLDAVAFTEFFKKEYERWTPLARASAAQAVR